MSGLRYLQIEPTTRCNFTCGFCCGRYMEQRDMNFADFQAILDAAGDELEHIELQGEGESLMHDRFFDMVEAARSRDVKVSFISNGSLLIPKTVERLLDLGIDKISVSIESPDPELFREIRGGKLEKVVRNLEHLMKRRAERGLHRPVVGFSITVLKKTKDDLPEILALYRALGLDGGITLQPLQRMEAYTAIYGEEVAAQTLDDEEVERLWMSFFSDPAVRAVEQTRGAVPGFYDELMEGWKAGSGTCPWLEQGLYVDTQGNATPCCMVKDTEGHGFGQVGRDELAAIMARRDQLRAELASGQIPTPCSGCEVARYATMPKSGLVGFALRGLWARIFHRSRPPGDPLVRLRVHG